MLAVVWCQGKRLNEEIITQGYAEIYRRFCSASEFEAEEWALTYGCVTRQVVTTTIPQAAPTLSPISTIDVQTTTTVPPPTTIPTKPTHVTPPTKSSGSGLVESLVVSILSLVPF